MNKCKISEISIRKPPNDGGILFGWFLFHKDMRIRNERYGETGYILPLVSPKTTLFLLTKMTLCNLDAEPLKYCSVLQKKIKKVLWDKASLFALRKPGWILFTMFLLSSVYLNTDTHTYICSNHTGVVYFLHTAFLHHSPCSAIKKADNTKCLFSLLLWA